MITEAETLHMIEKLDFDSIYRQVDIASKRMIEGKIKEIPSSFFEQNITLDTEGKQKISLIQFSSQMLGASNERKKGLMEKYKINPSDLQKLQSIVESIQVTMAYSNFKHVNEKEETKENESVYGFSLSSQEQVDKAYPLWVAYLCADAIHPLSAVKDKLKEDGVEEKYHPEMIVGLIEHVNELMKDKEGEKKDFFIHSISSILGSVEEIVSQKEEIEI